LEIGTLVTPDTLLRWHRELIAKKYDGSQSRRSGRPRTAVDIEELVVCQNSTDRNPKRNRPFVPPAVCHRSVDLSRLPTRVIG
jgi:hypothetical protein